ncbi:phosphopantothenoylcysteine decarboxylase [Helicobacter sp. MIT 14-3879]|uniref:phosphopantothenoylcysteine decarboxylase domain-containing protein n=1 Tax=Helicobacter sp. MIT 14-3879 TaxID=2040649 RepID=UPI000E1EA4A8|nr:phosphopantothenoylcysteine decarboxylase [Helicobacter sp. MIT 14-3879]RDU61350.1 hypothetical protein CQA44_09285 [Helicobacter sp. MIT 14-3879]
MLQDSQNLREKTYLFLAEALSDYIPQTKNGKLKKKDLGEIMRLELYQNIDILRTINAPHLVKIAFKAECDEKDAKENALRILNSKNCAMVCLNIITEHNKGFGSHENNLFILSKESPSLPQHNTTGYIYRESYLQNPDFDHNSESKQMFDSALDSFSTSLVRFGLKDCVYRDFSFQSMPYREYQLSGTKFALSLALSLYIESLNL